MANPTQNPAPNGATNVWANWSGVRTLQHGGQYGICAQGQYTVPERLAVDLGRSELVLDGHDAGAPGVHDDRPLQADGGAPARGRSGVRQEHERRAEGRLRRRCRRARSPRTSSASRSAATTGGVRHEQGRDLRLQRVVLGPRQRRQVDDVQLHRQLRRHRGRRRVGLRDRGRRLDPGQPERPEPDRHGRQGQPLHRELRQRGGRPHGAGGGDQHVLDDGQGRPGPWPSRPARPTPRPA